MRTRWLALALVPLVACGRKDDGTGGDEATEAEAAALTTDTSNVEGSVQTMTTDPLTMAEMGSGEMAATTAASKAENYLQPKGCYMAVAAGNKVTYTFNNCTGPYGLVKANGTVVATFTPAGAGSIKVDVAASGFRVNDVTVNLAFSGTFTVQGAKKSATIATTSSATSAKGKTITRAGSYTVTWDGMCLSLDGAVTTTVGTTVYATTFGNFKKCRGMCPSGSITFASSKGTSLILNYNGTATATWTSGTKMGTIPLLCL
jgi:hypothetical protein